MKTPETVAASGTSERGLVVAQCFNDVVPALRAQLRARPGRYRVCAGAWFHRASGLEFDGSGGGGLRAGGGSRQAPALRPAISQ